MKLELLFLGSGNAFAPGRGFNSFLLNRRMLFEAGPTTLPALKSQGISLKSIRVLFISHFHGDHTFGLPFIFLDHFFVTQRKDPLTIVGPKGIKEKTHQIIDLAYPNMRRKQANKFPVKFVEVNPGRVYRIGDFSLKAYRMIHDEGSLGFRLTKGGIHFAYCGDAGPSPQLTAMLDEVQLAVLEMTTLSEKLPSHLNRGDILRIRKGLPADSRIILTHLPRLTPGQVRSLVENPYGPLELAEDGKVFTFNF
jgi:ribonuclease Z